LIIGELELVELPVVVMGAPEIRQRLLHCNLQCSKKRFFIITNHYSIEIELEMILSLKLLN